MPTYSIDSQLPSFYERECLAVVELRVYAAGSSLAVANSGTFTLRDSSKQTVVTGAVTFPGGVATYTVPAASLPLATPLSGFWQEEWVLTFGTHVETFRRDAYLCLRLMHSTVTETMLLRRVSDLAAIRPPGITSYDPYIQEAFGIVQRTLLTDGKRPYLIMNDFALCDWHLALTLELAFRDFATYTGEGRFSAEAEKYRADADKAFDRLRLEYDTTEQNTRTAANPGQSATPVIYSNYAPAQAFRWMPRRY